VDLVLLAGSFWRHCTAMVLKFPEKAVCSASTTEPLATKLYISVCLLLLPPPFIAPSSSTTSGDHPTTKTLIPNSAK
jgi:hypothetical protein